MFVEYFVNAFEQIAITHSLALFEQKICALAIIKSNDKQTQIESDEKYERCTSTQTATENKSILTE
jgi:hypothetical protein